MRGSLNIVSKVTEAWEDNDPSLPPGWRIKRYKSKTENKRVHCEFLSPGMRVFRSRRAVADHLKEQGAPKEQISRLEAGSSYRPETAAEVSVAATTAMAASAANSSTASLSVGESSIGSTTHVARDPLSTAVIEKQPLATRTLPFPKLSPFSQSLETSSNLPLSFSTSLPYSSIPSPVPSSSPIWRSTILPPSSNPPSWSGPTAGSPPSQAFLPGRPVVLEAKQEVVRIVLNDI